VPDPNQAPQGLFTYPGILQIVSGTFTISHGITPSRAMVECAPQAGFEEAGGLLTLSFGGIYWAFADCKVDRHTIRTNERGQIWSLEIEDRRWRWIFGEISGAYNIRDDDQKIRMNTEKDPQSLAILCLQAMGEAGYDVSQIPNASRPEISWEAENPAQALNNLVEMLGCRVVLRLDNTVAIALIGVGLDLPIFGMPIMENSLKMSLPKRPDSISVVCGKTRFQADILLEPVAQDTDLTIKPIAQLSYAPADWSKEDPEIFSGVVDAPVLPIGTTPRQLALQQVWKWYRITYIDPHTLGILNIPGYNQNPIQTINQLLPIEDIKVETTIIAPPNTKAIPEPAEIRGVWLPELAPPGVNKDPDSLYKESSFSIDGEKGIVKFAKWLVKMVPDPAGGWNYEAAKIYIRCAVSIRDPNTQEWARYRRTFVYPGPAWGTLPRILKHEELHENIFPTYINQVPQQDQNTLNTNLTELNPACDYYIAGADQEYQIPLPYDLKYAGLVPINPDGAIQQVTWEIGIAGATTRASRNNEWHPFVPVFEEKLYWQKLRELKRANLAQRDIDRNKQLDKFAARGGLIA
jgi:hypothetical protein